MKFTNILFNSTEETRQQIEKIGFGKGEGSLVRIHYSGTDKEEAFRIAKEIKGILPFSKIVGVPVSGLIYEAEIYEEGTLISITQFDNTFIENFFFSTEDLENIEVANKVMELIKDKNKSFAFLFFGGLKTDSSQIMKELSDQLVSISFVGGKVGHISKTGEIIDFIFDDEKILDNGVSLTIIKDEYVLAYTNTVIGNDPLTPPYKITKVAGDYEIGGNFITEIENENSVTWMKKILNIDSISKNEGMNTESINNDILIRFPFILEGRDGASRFISYNEEKNTFELYMSSLREGQKFRLGYLSPLKSVQEWQEICGELQITSAEYLGCYSCAFRKMYLENLSEWEMTAFKETGISGAFLLGEIGNRSGKNYYLHGSCSVFSFAQQENYLELNLAAFDSISTIQNNNISFIKSQLEITDEKSCEIFENLVKQEYKTQQQMLSDNIYGIENMTDFLKTQAVEKCKKICFVYQNSISEEEKYTIAFDTAKETINNVKLFLEKNYSSSKIKLYSFDDTNFFFTANKNIKEADFIELTQKLFTECRNIKIENSEKEYKNTFVVTISETQVHELYEIADKNKNNPGKYLISDNSTANTDTLQNEFRMVAELNEILKCNTIIPYFQGIYDNKKGNFFCYEALMRLQTADGKILIPSQFMEISKKYNIYVELSYQMISLVLDIFKDRQESITMNVSAIDIHSKKFNTMIKEKLSNVESPERFIFEIVETEQYSFQKEVESFIKMVKSYGAKIAIDDFGSGYSNFVEIGSLDVDLIKVDGSITSLLDTDTRYSKILESIKYLGKKMHVDLIAESVETASMQKQILSMGIRYSQGYFFSTPMPFEELEIVSLQNEEKKANEKEEEAGTKLFVQDEIAKKQMKRILIMAPIVAIVMIVVILTFTTFTKSKVEELSDNFLIEIGVETANEIASNMEASENMIATLSVAATNGAVNNNDIIENLSYLKNNSSFDEIFISFDEETLLDTNGNLMPISIKNVTINHSTTSEQGSTIDILSPVINDDTKEEYLLIRTSIERDGEKIGEVYGAYLLEEFRKVLDLKSFGGEAFYHICEIDGTPIVVSGDGDNLFKGDDMYVFIGSLDISNGHTIESIKNDMKEGEAVLLKYTINNEDRSAVMTPIPNTNWCIVNIIQNEIVSEMASDINNIMYIFVGSMLIIVSVYFILSVKTLRKNQKSLINSLETSYFLTNSLQAAVETDALTRTYTRVTAIEKISEIINSSNQNDKVHALVIVDVDNFKAVNDKYGHNAGDVYLQEVVSIIKSCLRAGDIIGRIGGDEFILFFNDVHDMENIKSVLDRIQKNINNIKSSEDYFVETSISAGVAIYPRDGDTYQTLNHKADNALYLAKRTGKNIYKIYND